MLKAQAHTRTRNNYCTGIQSHLRDSVTHGVTRALHQADLGQSRLFPSSAISVWVSRCLQQDWQHHLPRFLCGLKAQHLEPRHSGSVVAIMFGSYEPRTQAQGINRTPTCSSGSGLGLPEPLKSGRSAWVVLLRQDQRAAPGPACPLSDVLSFSCAGATRRS